MSSERQRQLRRERQQVERRRAAREPIARETQRRQAEAVLQADFQRQRRQPGEGPHRDLCVGDPDPADLVGLTVHADVVEEEHEVMGLGIEGHVMRRRGKGSAGDREVAVEARLLLVHL